ncbi:zinc finger matrin-type protein 3 isoform X2 [Scaptodrosophila lebanonensis]|uniref:Zinc finger matrin-type protein 3 isoform X2 n=1 Tax=Drosophila lebanonensis TaxID=7225 RepID=A0A6J2TTY4_DROLE|nr:zinc finger matrin-type protein 3 isoform X2 [Scaptodrosophila lebanonensis]
MTKESIMNSDCLGKYHIPLLKATAPGNIPVQLSTSASRQTEASPTELVNASAGAGIDPSFGSLQGNFRRFLPPWKHEMACPPSSSRPLKRKLDEKTVESKDGKHIVMFPGRDASYPDELNLLIHPLSCELCKVQLSSIRHAKDHYESKAHDRHISAWLAKNYTDMGLPSPAIKRLVKVGATGPNAFHCELCDLSLTSLSHARQHYSGRKHKLVEQKRRKPSGSGFYNSDGKWVRTNPKIEPITANDGRFGIGVKFASNPLPNSDSSEVTNDIKPELGSASGNGPPIAAPLDDSLCCRICNISVTSISQMQMHLDGIKHKKKLRSVNIDPDAEKTESIAVSITDPKVEGDLSMYRTPSGKKHLKAVRQQTNN